MEKNEVEYWVKQIAAHACVWFKQCGNGLCVRDKQCGNERVNAAFAPLKCCHMICYATKDKFLILLH